MARARCEPWLCSLGYVVGEKSVWIVVALKPVVIELGALSEALMGTTLATLVTTQPLHNYATLLFDLGGEWLHTGMYMHVRPLLVSWGGVASTWESGAGVGGKCRVTVLG